VCPVARLGTDQFVIILKTTTRQPIGKDLTAETEPLLSQTDAVEPIFLCYLMRRLSAVRHQTENIERQGKRAVARWAAFTSSQPKMVWLEH
jgi:hypothetical protein